MSIVKVVKIQFIGVGMWLIAALLKIIKIILSILFFDTFALNFGIAFIFIQLDVHVCVHLLSLLHVY
jgi:hypothetical protein